MIKQPKNYTELCKCQTILDERFNHFDSRTLLDRKMMLMWKVSKWLETLPAELSPVSWKANYTEYDRHRELIQLTDIVFLLPSINSNGEFLKTYVENNIDRDKFNTLVLDFLDNPTIEKYCEIVHTRGFSLENEIIDQYWRKYTYNLNSLFR